MKCDGLRDATGLVLAEGAFKIVDSIMKEMDNPQEALMHLHDCLVCKNRLLDFLDTAIELKLGLYSESGDEAKQQSDEESKRKVLAFMLGETSQLQI